MSNILIIKHGSLGDIVQISGVLKDIRESHVNEKIFILTTNPYVELLGQCPYVDGVLLDKRLPRWNFFYLGKLKKMIEKYNFLKIFDLQNSSRTSFYRKYLFKKTIWCSAETTLIKQKQKNDHRDSVLDRFKAQLENFDIKVENTLKPDLNWACINIDKIINKFSGKRFILIFPFSSSKLKHKQWPHYNKLINIIKSKHSSFDIFIAPGPKELEIAESFEGIIIKNDKRALNILELAGLIKKSSFVISNDTGPAHMSAHLNKEGIVIFGHHTTPEKVSIETKNFKPIVTDNLEDLSAELIYSKIKEKLESIY